MNRVLHHSTTRKTKSVRAPAPHGLTRRDWRIIQRVGKLVHAVLPNGELKSLILYGSHTRGQATPDSDIDLFLVYDDVTAEQENSLKELVVTLPLVLARAHLFLYRADDLAKNNGTNPLIYNVAHQGITLEGTPVPKLEIDRRHVAERNLELAREQLASAQHSLNGNFYRDTISRSYYAVLHAADAALATKGFVAKSRAGTDSLFGLHFVKTGLVDKRFGGLVGRAADVRLKADYDHEIEFTRADAEHWLARAQEFVGAIDAALPGWLAEK